MSESEIVLPLDETIWDYVDTMEGSVGVQVSDTKALDLLGALFDVWQCANAGDAKEAGELVIGIAALLIAAPLGQADKVWQELVVRESMKNFEIGIREITNDDDKSNE